MAVLNDWQKLDYIFSGKPFGDGADGSPTVSSCPNTYAIYTGTINLYTGTLGSAILSNGDLVVILQTQGTGNGNWQFNRVASGGGTTSITWTKPNKYSYVSGCQVIKIPRYIEPTINAHSVTAWDGSKGGVEILCAKKSIIMGGNVNGKGLGFVGSTKVQDPSYSGWSESAGGNGYASQSLGGTHGGDETPSSGGYGTNGGGSYAGSAFGSADLTSFNLGAGGAGGNGGDTSSTNGGTSGASMMYITKSFVGNSKDISVDGGNTGDALPGGRSGGGGAGSSFLLICDIASIGTNNIHAYGGTSGQAYAPSGRGATGGVGRIAIHHMGTITGSTSPSYTDVSGYKFIEIAGASMLQVI